MDVQKISNEIDIVGNSLMTIIDCEYDNVTNLGFSRADAYKIIICALQCVSARAVVTYAVENVSPDGREPFFDRALAAQREDFLSCLKQNTGTGGVSSCLN